MIINFLAKFIQNLQFTYRIKPHDDERMACISVIDILAYNNQRPTMYL